MSLETGCAGAASENQRGQHGQRCENPLHGEPPFARRSLVSPGSYVYQSGGLVGDLRVYLGPIRVRDEINGP
jgi:hypothetical protein